MGEGVGDVLRLGIGLDGAAGSHFQPNGNLVHCPCQYVPGVAQFGQAWDIGGLIVPRGLLTITPRNDTTNPPVAVQRAVNELQRSYAVADASDRYGHRFGEGGRPFDTGLAWEFVSKLCGRMGGETGDSRIEFVPSEGPRSCSCR